MASRPNAHLREEVDENESTQKGLVAQSDAKQAKS